MTDEHQSQVHARDLGQLGDQYAEFSRGRLHYVTAGSSGQAVVLLHGWPGFWFDYRDVLSTLAEHARAVAPDFFGFGASSALEGDPVEVADEVAYAGDILELIDHIGFDQVLLVGYDIGSAVAARVARLAPLRVRGLVLLNPTHPYIGDKRYAPAAQREAWYQHFHVLPLAEQLLDGDRLRLEHYLGYFYSHWAGEGRTRADDFSLIVDTFARPGAFASSIAWYRARAARRDSEEVPPAVLAPTLALWGDSDPMRPLEHREGFELAFPNSTSRVLAGVGHFVPAEAPDAVVEAIVQCLMDT
jgi:pimeloyl-ACP methyl ester carboxylesterase